LENIDSIIQGCIKWDRYAQSQLYELFADKMFMVCLRYSRNREEAEETLQEGFLKIYKFIHQYRSSGSFEGWIRKILVNTCLEKYRSKPQMHVIMDIEMVPTDDVDNEEILNRLGIKELLKMIQLLPPAYRMVFNLYVFEGMKHREIAVELGISEGTSKSNLSDARTLLRKAIDKSSEVAIKKINYL
jgi:RNA polymerase sigma factor (sigma-70 family)